ncbi:MAG: hypothetical protein K2Y22_00720 [Candidatus Obscuribacterales bacterium]|nr:hypothetical protein [Candidatus Obscuribacterales bacterium]
MQFIKQLSLAVVFIATIHVVLEPLSREMNGVVDLSGRFMPFSFANAGTVLTLPASAVGFLVDPVTLKIKGMMTVEGTLFDTRGNHLHLPSGISIIATQRTAHRRARCASGFTLR